MDKMAEKVRRKAFFPNEEQQEEKRKNGAQGDEPAESRRLILSFPPLIQKVLIK